MTSFAEFSVRRPLGVLLVIAAVTLFGFLAINQLPLLFLPEIESPPSPWSRPIPILHPKRWSGGLRSRSRRHRRHDRRRVGQFHLVCQFCAGAGAVRDRDDMDLAAAEIRDRIDRIRATLPAGVGRIRVSNFSTTDIPILQLSVAYQGPRGELERLTEDLVVPQLQRLDGVAEVDVRGLQAERVMIDLDPAALAALNLTVDDVTRSLRNNNVDIAGGYLIDGGRRYFVRTLGSFTELEEIAALPLGRGTQPTAARIGDVATVRLGVGEVENIQRLDLEEAVTVRVFKSSDANVVSVVRSARAQLAAIETATPGLATFVFFDQSEEITTSLNNLRNSGLIGAGLAVLVLFAFLLRVRATLVVALAIPISIIATFSVVFLMRRVGGLNFSLNVISLSGLMLAVGMLLDNSVVVLENIFRYREQGLAPRAAAVRGAGEVTTPVVAATVTSIIVFVPVLFTSTTSFGRFMGDFAVTMVAAMIASLVISLSLIPVVSSRFLVDTGASRRHRLMDRLSLLYRGVLRWTLRHRLLTVVGMLVILGGGVYLLTKIEREFVPPTPARRMSVAVSAENGVTFDETRAVFDAFERELSAGWAPGTALRSSLAGSAGWPAARSADNGTGPKSTTSR